MMDETFIAVLIDQSGSMRKLVDDVIGGFNTFVDEQRAVGSNAFLTLVLFNSENIATIHESTPIHDVPVLTSAVYKPTGMTPLLDALGTTIQRTGAILSAIPEVNRPSQVVFLIVTDGFENVSTVFTKNQILEMVAHQEQVYSWNFVYQGANVDAFAEASQIGIATAAAATFNPNNVQGAMRVASANVANYRRSRSRSSLNYSDEQRKEMMRDRNKTTTS